MLDLIRGLLQLLVFGLLLFVCVWVIRRVHLHEAGGWILKSVLVLIGVGAGIGLCFVRYQPNPDLAIFGLPLPLAMFHRQGTAWVDYVAHPMMTLLIGLLNTIIVTAIVHGSALAVLKLVRRPSAAGTS
jgi:hypothetical protein